MGPRGPSYRGARLRTDGPRRERAGHVALVAPKGDIFTPQFFAELKRVTDQIEPVDLATIEAAVEACTAENMRKMSEKMSTHVRSGKVGESREKLSEAHFAIFRERYADLIEKLGYEVR